MFEYLVFEEREAFSLIREIRLEVYMDELRYKCDGFWFGVPEVDRKSGTYEGDVEAFLEKLESFGVDQWSDEYYKPMADGFEWSLRYKEVGRPCRKISGTNDGPECYREFVGFLFSASKEEDMLDFLRYTESENGILFRKYEIKIREGNLVYKFTGPYFSEKELGEHSYSGDAISYVRMLEKLGFRNWEDHFVCVPMLDGIDWILEYKYGGEDSKMISGSGRGPQNIQEFVFALNPDSVKSSHVLI